MSYSDFKTPEEVIDRFGLEVNSSDLFGGSRIALVEPSDRLAHVLRVDLPQATNINTSIGEVWRGIR